MSDYKLHYDEINQQWWIGKIARDQDGKAMFVQQVGDYFQYKGSATRALKKLEASS